MINKLTLKTKFDIIKLCLNITHKQGSLNQLEG